MTFPEWMGRFPRDSAQWQLSEDKHLVEQFRCGNSLENLVSTHGRPSHAIESRLFKLLETNYAKKEQEKLRGNDFKPFNTEEASNGKPIEAFMRDHWSRCEFVVHVPRTKLVVVKIRGYTYNVKEENVRMVSRKLYILTSFTSTFTFHRKEEMEAFKAGGNYINFKTLEVDLD